MNNTESISRETYTVNNELQETPEIEIFDIGRLRGELLDNQWVNWRYEQRDGKPPTARCD